MNQAAESAYVPFSRLEELREARAILRCEAEAVLELSRRLDTTFCDAVQLLFDCRGTVIVCGIGKAGLIGRKLTATLASTGTRSHFLHPAEAVHGDLGCLSKDDVLLVISNSGETEEIVRILPALKSLGGRMIAMTSSGTSTLGRAADVVVSLGRLREAGAEGLAPTTTTAVMLAVGDALALSVSRRRGFSSQQFAVFHPGGNLGRRLRTVRDIMRQGDDVRIASETITIREVLVGLSRPGRRTGAVMIANEQGELTGLFTDSDLARLLECRKDSQLDQPIRESMTKNPATIGPDATLEEVVEFLSKRKFSELPVVDEQRQPIGMIDITDVIGELPAECAA